MRTSISTALITFVALLCSSMLASPANAGPWVKSPGSTYIKLSGAYFASDKSYDLDGDLMTPPYDYSQRALRAYGELGILPNTAFRFSTSFKHSQNVTNDGRMTYNRWGPGDLDVGLQYQLFSGGCAAAAQFDVRIPIYPGGVNADSEAPTTSGSTGVTRYTPALGDGSVDLVPSAAIGCSLGFVPGWASVQAGPRIRFGGFGEALDYAADIGVFVWPDRLALSARVGGIQRFKADNPSPTKSYISVGGGTLLRIYKGLAFEATGSYIPWGAFVARGWSVSGGFSYTGEIFSNPFN